MHARLPIAVWLLIAAPGCGERPAGSPRAPTPPPAAPDSGAPDGGALRATTLTYAGTHSGDHPSWSYRAIVTLTAAERAGRPVWRRTSTLGDGMFAATLDVDRRTLAAVHAELRWNDATMQLDFSPGRTTGVVERAGTRREVARDHREPAVLYDALDLYIAALPLAPGFHTRLTVLDQWLLDEPGRYGTRDFTIRVTREDTVAVPAGSLPVFVVAIDPTDGDQRLRAVYHVATTRPHYPVRMEYVVNAVTAGPERRSTGVDQLISRADAA